MKETSLRRGRRKQEHCYPCPYCNGKCEDVIWWSKRLGRLKCNKCGRTFSVFKNTVLYRMRKSKTREIVEMLEMLCRGMSFESAAQVKEVKVERVVAVFRRVARACRKITENAFKNGMYSPLAIQLDELKDKVLKKEMGVWVWHCIDAVSKLWIAFQVGGRSYGEGLKLFRQLRERISEDPWVASTDGLTEYVELMKKFFRTTGFGQVIKVYEGKKVKKVKRKSKSPRTPLWVLEHMFQLLGIGSQLNTVYTERLNKTLRHCICRLIRKTMSVSKKLEELVNHLSVVQVFYNFIRTHMSLRQGSHRKTPAMAAGLTDHKWSWYEVLSYPC